MVVPHMTRFCKGRQLLNCEPGNMGPSPARQHLISLAADPTSPRALNSLLPEGPGSVAFSLGVYQDPPHLTSAGPPANPLPLNPNILLLVGFRRVRTCRHLILPTPCHFWENPKLFFEIQLLKSLVVLQRHDRELYGSRACFTMPYVKT